MYKSILCYTWLMSTLFINWKPENLKQLRKDKGITQKVLSEQTGVPLPSVKCYELGTLENPTIQVLKVFGDFYKVKFYI